MSLGFFHLATDILLYTMQLSIVVPMIVVWRRQRQFPPAIKLLSWYVYLSAFCSIAAKLGAMYLHNNQAFLIGFNMGKLLLFAMVYGQVMPDRQRLLQWITIAAGAIAVLTMGYEMVLAVDVARVLQCALLAGFAILYIDFQLADNRFKSGFQNPMWLLSVGQLIYSAGTVTSFAFDYVFHSINKTVYYIDLLMAFVSVSGLVFNAFLTLAFLRARCQEHQPTIKHPEMYQLTRARVE